MVAMLVVRHIVVRRTTFGKSRVTSGERRFIFPPFCDLVDRGLAWLADGCRTRLRYSHVCSPFPGHRGVKDPARGSGIANERRPRSIHSRVSLSRLQVARSGED